MIKIHTHQVLSAKPETLLFRLSNDHLRLSAAHGGSESYVAQVVSTKDLGLGYGRGIYGHDRLLQLPVDAEEGDVLYLFESTDRDTYHTRYWMERHSARPEGSVHAYRHVGDHLEEQGSA
jgi:hypothetical protein